MTMLRGRIAREGAGKMVVAGAASIAIDQRLRPVKTKVGDDALAADWQAVGNDLRHAIGQARREFKAA